MTPVEADETTPEVEDTSPCQWVDLDHCVRHFVGFAGRTQSARQIKPLHWYVACRLVLEGGFHPDNITPRPPFEVVVRGGASHLVYNPVRGGTGERTILGGLKTKNVDVVVALDGLGPVLAVSCKGMIGALRNLTNRMEEAVGECTNLHITYPALVLGFLYLLRGNRADLAAAERITAEPRSGRQILANDIAIREGGAPVESVLRFHSALRELTGRKGIRDDVSRYEATALLLAEPGEGGVGRIIGEFPERDSIVNFDLFFRSMFQRYDERFVFGAPALRKVTGRALWARSSAVFDGAAGNPVRAFEYEPRVGD